MSRININNTLSHIAAAAMFCATLVSSAAVADPYGYAGPFGQSYLGVEQDARDSGNAERMQDAMEVPAKLKRHVVDYWTRELPGTIVIDTPNTSLYFVLAGGKAIHYAVGVGREGFTWSGVRSVGRMAEWPDWIPPSEMIERQPYLPRFMAGGPGNPLGARAIYLEGTLYRIHGTNARSTIGKRVSSGCIRMLNEDVIDLYSRVHIGTKVVVLPMQPNRGPYIGARNQSAPNTTPFEAAAIGRTSGIY